MNLGQLLITLPPETAARVQREAEARGVSAEAVVAEAVESWVLDPALDWEEDLRRLEEPGEDVDATVVFAELRESIETARRSKP